MTTFIYNDTEFLVAPAGAAWDISRKDAGPRWCGGDKSPSPEIRNPLSMEVVYFKVCIQEFYEFVTNVCLNSGGRA